jgi:23S rRNA pseudouridine2605 synthase
VRLQKLLASAGVGSRRQCEEIILSGRVEVDGKTVTELGTRVDSRTQKIVVDGEPIKFERRMYFAVNKPTGVLSTNRDPAGRMRVVDLVGENARLFPVGRLDLHSEGLIIVTNDGELAERLTHPRYGVPKRYLVQVAGEAPPELAEQLVRGVHLEEGVARAKAVYIRHRHKNSTQLEIVLAEGRNREIRRMLAGVGHKVQRLTRVAVGPIRLGKLKPGQYRPLDRDEISQLRELALGGPPAPRQRKVKPRRRAKPVRAASGAISSKRERVARPPGKSKPHPLPFLKKRKPARDDSQS